MRPSTTHWPPEVTEVGTERPTNPTDDSDRTGGNTTPVGGAPFRDTPSVGGLNSRNKPFVELATRGFVPHSLEQPALVEPKRREREWDDATLGLPTASPSLEVTACGVYDATAAASGLGTPGPPCPFRPTLRVTGNLKFQGRETRQSYSQLPTGWIRNT